MLSDMWMLSKPSDELGGWAALPEQDVNLWARVRFQTGADTSPGIRFFHTMLTELPENATGRSAILFGGAIPQPLSSPVFNYEVWRLTLDDTLSTAGEREATASWSRVPVDDQGSIINHPPVIGHSATMDANGNMMVPPTSFPSVIALIRNCLWRWHILQPPNSSICSPYPATSTICA